MIESQKRRDGRAPAHEKGASSSASKPLKSSEPDLVIVCRYEGKEEMLHYHSVAMAIHSSYFDSLLASGMQESVTKTVTLEDVDPGTFQKAVEILEDPNSVLTVSAEEMLTVAPLYNRFEFKNGLKLAETVIGKFMEDWTKAKGKSPNLSEHRLIGDSILFSHEANLENLTEKSISFVKQKLKDGTSLVDIAIFDQSFIEKIAPFLDEHRASCLTELYSHLYPNGLQEKLQAADLLVHLQWWLLSTLALQQLKPLGLRLKGRLALAGDQSPTTTIHAGLYRTTTGRLGDGQEILSTINRILNEEDMVWFNKMGEIGDWAIHLRAVGRARSYRFVWPRSKSFPLPPVGNQWILGRNDDENHHSEPEATFEVVSIEPHSTT